MIENKPYSTRATAGLDGKIHRIPILTETNLEPYVKKYIKKNGLPKIIIGGYENSHYIRQSFKKIEEVMNNRWLLPFVKRKRVLNIIDEAFMEDDE